MNKYLSIITLNVNELNASIKRHRVAEWIRKHELHICCLQKTHFRKKITTQNESGVLEKSVLWKWAEKKVGIIILMADKIHFKTQAIKRHRRTPHNTQGKNLMRRHKHYKHLCTQHRSPQIYEENLGRLQERHIEQHNYTRRF